MLTTHRDAHIYIFPYWVMEMIRKNEKFESISEEVMGWWAKASWQDGLGEKLGLRQILQEENEESDHGSQMVEEDIDVSKFSTTYSGNNVENEESSTTALASRVTRSSSIPDSAKSLTANPKLTIPPILAYVQPSGLNEPLIRRVDDSHLLLTISLRLAKLPSIEEVGKEAASPFAHHSKIAHKESIPRKCRVEAENSLLADNVIVEEKTNIKESVIGSNCKIGEGARLLRCLLMDGVEVGPNVQLTDCILGRRCKMEGGDAKDGDKTVLKDCEVQDGQVIEWGSKSTAFFLDYIHKRGMLTVVQLRPRTKSLCASTWVTMWVTMWVVGALVAMKWMVMRVMMRVSHCGRSCVGCMKEHQEYMKFMSRWIVVFTNVTEETAHHIPRADKTDPVFTIFDES